MLRGQFPDAVEDVYGLEVEWLFGPERTVIVKGGDPAGRGNEGGLIP